MNKTPSLISALRDEILSAPSAELPSIRGSLAALETELLARLFVLQQVSLRSDDASAAEDGGDTLLTVAETAQKLGQKVQWVRAHQDELPRVQLPGRMVRFSSRKLDAWLKRRTT